jgi:hypothetical protein
MVKSVFHIIHTDTPKTIAYTYFVSTMKCGIILLGGIYLPVKIYLLY